MAAPLTKTRERIIHSFVHLFVHSEFTAVIMWALSPGPGDHETRRPAWRWEPGELPWAERASEGDSHWPGATDKEEHVGSLDRPSGGTGHRSSMEGEGSGHRERGRGCSGSWVA